MQLRPGIQIRSMLKAMVEVVCPAIDPRNPLALEQAGFVVGLLKLMEEQLPLLYRYDRDELERLVRETATLSSLTTSDETANAAVQAFRARVELAKATLNRCAGDPAELTVAIREMRRLLAELVTATSDSGETDALHAVTQVVVRVSGEQLIRERSMLKSQGWEKDPAAIPDLKDLLSARSVP